MDKTLRSSLLDGLQGVKHAYVKTRGIEADSLLNTSVESTVDPGNTDHEGGGALAPKDNFNLWED